MLALLRTRQDLMLGRGSLSALLSCTDEYSSRLAAPLESPPSCSLPEGLPSRAGRLRAVGVLIFALVCFGLTNIVTGGKICRPLREGLARRFPWLGEWIDCPMCFGFWVGAFWDAAGLFPRVGVSRLVEVIAAASISSAVCWIVHVALVHLGADEL